MAEELKANQRKEWAKLMYLKENITQQEIADRVGVSRVTVNKWVKEWEGLKLNLLQTREERISSTLTQLDELDRSIAGKEEGKRYPSAAEADIRLTLRHWNRTPPSGIYTTCPVGCSIGSDSRISKGQRS